MSAERADDVDDPNGHAGHDHTAGGGRAAPQDVTGVTPGTDGRDTAAAAAAARPSVVARPLIGLVRGYQYVFAGRPSPCRHVPSCSTYAVEALQLHGATKGTWLTARRIARCQPWGTQGYDPVPERKAA
jgi:uncharacterized protein